MRAIIGLMFVFASACGGGGSSSVVEDPSFDGVLTSANATIAAYEAARASDAPTTTTGSVSYAGFAELAEFPAGESESVYSAVGKAAIEADFDTLDLKVDVTEIYETDARIIPALLNNQSNVATQGEAVAGSLSMDFDTSDLATRFFTGTITKSNGEVASYRLGLGAVEAWGANDEVFEGGATGGSAANGRPDRDALLIFVGERD